MTEEKKIMFDMDGTLINSLWGWMKGHEKFLEDNNLEVDSSFLKKIEGKTLYERGRIIIEHFNIDMEVKDMYENNLKNMKIFYDTEFVLKENIRESLDYLKEKGVKMSLNTATSEEVCIGLLERLDLLKYFEYVQTPKNCGYAKDNEKFYEIAIEKHGIEAKNIYFFDDSATPLRTAKKVGLKTVLVYDEISNGKHYKNSGEFDFKMDTISIENLQKIGF